MLSCYAVVAVAEEQQGLMNKKERWLWVGTMAAVGEEEKDERKEGMLNNGQSLGVEVAREGSDTDVVESEETETTKKTKERWSTVEEEEGEEGEAVKSNMEK
jgi:hypothetical protein